MEAFKATLEVAIRAAFLIHVIDASAEQALIFHQTTMEVLKELGAEDQPMITVLNKIDAVEDPPALHTLQSKLDNVICTSAKGGIGIDTLLHKCTEMLSTRVRRQQFRIPQSRGDLVAILHSECKIITTEYEENDILLEAIVPQSIAGKLKIYQQP